MWTCQLNVISQKLLTLPSVTNHLKKLSIRHVKVRVIVQRNFNYTYTQIPMRSYQHPASEHGTSCSHHVPSLCGCGEVQSLREKSNRDLTFHNYYDFIALCTLVRTIITNAKERVSVTMTSPITGRSKALNQNGPKKTYLRSGFRHPHSIFTYIMIIYIDHNFMEPSLFTYLCVCRRAPKLILPFLVVGLAFATGLAAFMPVVP